MTTRLQSSPGDARVAIAYDARAQLGEGPLWDARCERLMWVDLAASRLWTFEPASGAAIELLSGVPASAVVPRASGGWVVVVATGFAILQEDGALRNVTSVEPGRPGNRMNDGKCDPAGRLWAGSTAPVGMPEAGRLHRLDPDLTSSVLLEGVQNSNGLDWSPDGTLMYYVDTGTRRIDVFAFDEQTGTISKRKALVTIEVGAGMPDGLCIDAEGFIWVALWDGGAVRRYSPSGALDRVIEVPASRVTSCAFGGPDLDTLFITSARSGLSEEQLAREPHAGAIFRCRPGVRGRPPAPFAG